MGFNVKLPVTEKIVKEVLSIPVHPNVTKEQIEYIINVFRELARR